MTKLSNRSLELQLEPSSLLHTPVSIWIKHTDFLKTQDHLKYSIIYSQALRLSNICTYERDFQRHALDMK